MEIIKWLLFVKIMITSQIKAFIPNMLRTGEMQILSDNSVCRLLNIAVPCLFKDPSGVKAYESHVNVICVSGAADSECESVCKTPSKGMSPGICWGNTDKC